MNGMANQRVLVHGCGAMGSIYAGLLAASGHIVTAVTRNTAHVNAINARGLRVSGASGDRTVSVLAREKAPESVQDLIVLAVKAPNVAEAVEQIAPCIGEQTVILALQNGLGSAELVAARFGAERLMVGIAGGFGAELKSPGHVHHAGMKVIRFGALPEASESSVALSQLNAILRNWSSAGFTVEAASDIVVMQWEKLICNVAFSAPCALTGQTVGEALRDEDVGPLCLAAAEEAFRVALAVGVQLTFSDWERHVRTFAGSVDGARPSLLQDVEAGRPSEIDFINGAVVSEADRLGIDAPVNRTLCALVRQREGVIGSV